MSKLKPKKVPKRFELAALQTELKSLKANHEAVCGRYSSLKASVETIIDAFFENDYFHDQLHDRLYDEIYAEVEEDIRAQVRSGI